MATQKATDINSRITMADGAYGNDSVHYGKVALTSPGTSDVLRLVRIPAGFRVDELTIINDDVESSSTAMTVRIGYTPCNSDDGPVADEDYFFPTGSTTLTAKSRTTSLAKPKVFEYDVFIDIFLEAAPGAFIAGSEVHCIVRGENIGTD